MNRIVVLLACVAAPWTAWAEAGTVTFVEGTATRTPPSGASVALALDADVEVGDVIETGPGARVEIALADDSALRLDALSRVTIERVEAGAASWKVRLKLMLGSIWAKVAKRDAGAADFEVQTERLVAGVRGTEFVVEASGEHGVQVFEGEVEIGVRGAEQEGSARHWLRALHEIRVAERGLTAGPAVFAADRELRPFLKWARAKELRFRHYRELREHRRHRLQERDPDNRREKIREMRRELRRERRLFGR